MWVNDKHLLFKKLENAKRIEVTQFSNEIEQVRKNCDRCVSISVETIGMEEKGEIRMIHVII